MGRRRRGTAAVRGGRRRTGRRPRPRGDRGHAPVGPAVGGARRRAPRRPLRPPRVRPRRRRRHPVLEPRRPRRRHGRRRPRPGGARGLLAGGLDRHRHRAGVPGRASAASPGSAAASAGYDDRRDAGRGSPRSSEAEALGGREGLGGRCRPRRRDLGRWLRAARGARPCRGARRVRTMAFETYVQEKPYGDTIVLDPPAIGRLGGAPRAGARDDGRARHSATRVGARRRSSPAVPGARRIDLPDVAHMPSLERPEWFTATLLEFLESVP